jgi:folate-dependent phosphoribosylglycinamide formyltransferase PurN
MTKNASKQTVVLLTTAGQLQNIVANDLAQHTDYLVVLEEDGPPRGAMMKSRAQRLGWPTAIGQTIAHHLFRLVGKASSERMKSIEVEFGLNAQDQTGIEKISITSVNSDQCRNELQRLDPAVVAVYATRIIQKETLSCIKAPFINFHGGINPKYRGQHPVYWALAEKDPEHAGFTIHLVDEGVDTGKILYQSKVDFEPGDNVTTYQYRLTGPALPYLRRAIDDAISDELSPKSVDLPSRLWFPPTIWTYFWNGLFRRVW